jgi:hypothetical protein
MTGSSAKIKRNCCGSITMLTSYWWIALIAIVMSAGKSGRKLKIHCCYLYLRLRSGSKEK